MEPATTSDLDIAIIVDLLVSIDARLTRLEDLISQYEPLLSEVNRRMAGPLSWKKGR
jgi:hypothetical protein